MDVWMTLAEPTRRMVEAAREAGAFTCPYNGRVLSKIQILTLKDS